MVSLIEQIKPDREAGTAGPWELQDATIFTRRPCQWLGLASWENAWQAQFSQDGQHKTPREEVLANARRAQRVPAMEAALIAADELARAVDDWLHGEDDSSMSTPLAAYRKATEAAQ